jgi:hypothetical protein
MDEKDDPVLQMYGVGKEIWSNVDADEYVRNLRANWYGTKRDADDAHKPEDS